MGKVIIEVSGGLVSSIESDTDLEVVIIDRDLQGFKPVSNSNKVRPFMEYHGWPETQPGRLFEEIKDDEGVVK